MGGNTSRSGGGAGTTGTHLGGPRAGRGEQHGERTTPGHRGPGRLRGAAGSHSGSPGGRAARDQPRLGLPLRPGGHPADHPTGRVRLHPPRPAPRDARSRMTGQRGRERGPKPRSRAGTAGTVYPSGKKWAYAVTLAPDPLNGERRRDARVSSRRQCLAGLSLRRRRGEQLAHLRGGRDSPGADQLLVDDEAGGGHDAVADDGRVVGDLLDGGVEAEVVDGLAGGALEVDAVAAAGAEDLDDHDRSFRAWWLRRAGR